MLRRAKTSNIAGFSGRRSQRAVMEIQPRRSCVYPTSEQPRRLDVKDGTCTIMYAGKARQLGRNEFAVVPGSIEFTLYNPSEDTPVRLVERRL